MISKANDFLKKILIAQKKLTKWTNENIDSIFKSFYTTKKINNRTKVTE